MCSSRRVVVSVYLNGQHLQSSIAAASKNGPKENKLNLSKGSLQDIARSHCKKTSSCYLPTDLFRFLIVQVWTRECACGNDIWLGIEFPGQGPSQDFLSRSLPSWVRMLVGADTFHIFTLQWSTSLQACNFTSPFLLGTCLLEQVPPRHRKAPDLSTWHPQTSTQSGHLLQV